MYGQCGLVFVYVSHVYCLGEFDFGPPKLSYYISRHYCKLLKNLCNVSRKGQRALNTNEVKRNCLFLYIPIQYRRI